MDTQRGCETEYITVIEERSFARNEAIQFVRWNRKRSSRRIGDTLFLNHIRVGSSVHIYIQDRLRLTMALQNVFKFVPQYKPEVVDPVEPE